MADGKVDDARRGPASCRSRMYVRSFPLTSAAPQDGQGAFCTATSLCRSTSVHPRQLTRGATQEVASLLLQAGDSPSRTSSAYRDATCSVRPLDTEQKGMTELDGRAQENRAAPASKTVSNVRLSGAFGEARGES